MADDPRIEPTEEYIRLQFGVGADEANLAALGIIGEADHHDPLRALLADEDRAIELFLDVLSDWERAVTPAGNAVIMSKGARADADLARDLLAALREVAGL